MFLSPFALCLRSSVRSSFSSSSRSAVKSSGGEVPDRKGKQKDTLYLAFSVLPYING